MARFTRLLFMITALVSIGALGFAAEAASEAAGGGGGGGGGTHLSLFGMIMSAGPPEYLLLLFSMVSFGVAVQNMMVIKREALIPVGLADDVHQILSKDGITEEAVDNARAMVENDPTMQGRILASALAVSDLGYDAMREAATDATDAETFKWMQKPAWMSLFANQATLLGLFGTVWGIIESFMAMAMNPGGVDIVILAKTIGVSLITTANGMAVAVPMLAFAFAQRSKLMGFFHEINESTNEVLNYFRTAERAR
jgi:biopolymer transport protein ExbB